MVLDILRQKLHKAIDKYGINSKEVAAISNKIDKELNKLDKKRRNFKEGSETKEYYDKAIVELKKITQNFGDFPTVPEWNYYAKENNLLSSISIEYISGLNWKELREKILYETDKKIF